MCTICFWQNVALGELFSGGSLSLRADSSERPKLPGYDSRLNLVLVELRVCGCSCCISLAFVSRSSLCLVFLFFFLLRVILRVSVKNEKILVIISLHFYQKKKVRYVLMIKLCYFDIYVS